MSTSCFSGKVAPVTSAGCGMGKATALTLARDGAAVVVNDVHRLRATSPLETIFLEEWELMMAVNLRGVFLCTKAMLPIMKAKHSGKIANISSPAGRSTSTFGGPHYTASKAAVLGLARHTARKATPYNINVNAVAPASMDTKMVSKLATPGDMEREQQNISLRQLGTAQDEANLLAIICPEESACHLSYYRYQREASVTT